MRKRKPNYNYLKHLKEELKETSEKFDIPVESLQEMIDDMFYNIKQLIISKKMPRILLQSFGKFEPSYKKIDYLIWRWIRYIRDELRPNPDEESQKKCEKFKGKIRDLWAVRQRRAAEQRGLRTWYCWRDLPGDLSGYEECHKANESNCMECREESKKEEDI